MTMKHKEVFFDIEALLCAFLRNPPLSCWDIKNTKTSIELREKFSKGLLPGPNSMNFRKTSKRPLTPPPYFRKTMLRFFREAQKFATKFIRIGVTPPLFPKIHCFYRPKIFEKTATKFFGSEMTPPPFGSFPKIH